MESLGDILKRLSLKNTSGATGDWRESEPVLNAGGPNCPICHGVGWVRAAVRIGHPNFGKALACTCQGHDDHDQRLQRFRRYSNLGPLNRITFADSNADGPRAGSPANGYHNALEKARAFARHPEGWLILGGPSGSGKTHLAAAIANDLLEHDTLVFFVVVADLMDHLRSAFAPTSEISYDDLFEQVRSAPVLVLDDLGSHSSTPWAEEKLYQVINHRFNAKLPTVITLGVPMDRLDERLSARLSAQGLVDVLTLENRPRILLDQIPGSGLGADLLGRMTFDLFDVRGNNADAQDRGSLESALRGARAYAADPHGWLLLIGPNGCGKTHLAVAVANQQVKQGKSVLFGFVPALLDYLRGTFAPNSEIAYDQLFEQVRNAPLLILDDLGAHSSTPWAEEKLYQVIVHRHNARLPTVVTMSAALEALKQPGIASRLKDARLVNVLPISAPDYRDQDRPAPTRRVPSGHGQRTGR